MGSEKEVWEKFPLTAVGRSGGTRAISFAHHVQLGLALSKEASVANWSRIDIKEVHTFLMQKKNKLNWK